MANTYTVGDEKTYSTIPLMIAGIVATVGYDLTGDGIQTGEIYAKAATGNKYTGGDGQTGFTTTVNDYIIFTAMVLHGGKSQTAGGTGIQINAPGYTSVNYYIMMYLGNYGRIYGFEIGPYSIATKHLWGAVVINYGVTANNIVHDLNNITSTLAYSCVGIDDGAELASRGGIVYNNVVYNIKRSAINGYVAGIRTGLGSILNNTVYNCDLTGGSSVAYGIYSTNNSAVIKNNVSMNNHSQDFKWLGGETAGNTDYNCSSDATSDDRGATHCLINKTTANQFQNINIGAEDFHLKRGADCIGMATDLSGTFTNDYVNETRVTPWDIGAAKYIPDNLMMQVISG